MWNLVLHGLTIEQAVARETSGVGDRELPQLGLRLRYIQQTDVDKSAAIRLWGGVGGAKNKNMYTPLAPQTRRTTEY